MIPTFADILQKESFRKYVAQRLAKQSIKSDYCFPRCFPMLYKYRGFSTYAIDDIMKKQITMSPIVLFNDLYDSAIHYLSNEKDVDSLVNEQWREIAPLLSEDSPLKEEYYKQVMKESYKNDSRIRFWLADYLGSLICCLSETESSILMWSHYADSNQGICIEYDFNKLRNPIQKNSLLPVCYSNKPIEIDDLLLDEKRIITEFPIDSAILCSLLNKSESWKYEQEWRMIVVLNSEIDSVRLPLGINTFPERIILGNCFLKNFFYVNAKQEQKCEAKLSLLLRLLNFCKDNKIKISYMKHCVGEFKLKSISLDITELYLFISKHFNHNKPLKMRYYHVTQDSFLKMLDKEK